MYGYKYKNRYRERERLYLEQTRKKSHWNHACIRASTVLQTRSFWELWILMNAQTKLMTRDLDQSSSLPWAMVCDVCCLEIFAFQKGIYIMFSKPQIATWYIYIRIFVIKYINIYIYIHCYWAPPQTYDTSHKTFPSLDTSITLTGPKRGEALPKVSWVNCK